MFKNCSGFILFFSYLLFSNYAHAECSAYDEYRLSQITATCQLYDKMFSESCSARPWYDVEGSARIEIIPDSADRSVVMCRGYGCVSGNLMSNLIWLDGTISSSCAPPPPNDSTISSTPPKNPPSDNTSPRTQCGSIIQVSNQVVGETIPLTGVPFYLSHFSNRVLGRTSEYTIQIPISGNSVSSRVSKFIVKISDLSNNILLTKEFSPGPNLVFNYVWDGLENGQETWATVKRKISIIALNQQSTLDTREYSIMVGSLNAKKLGIGAWIPSVWHFYDSISEKIYDGNGDSRNVKAIQDGIYKRVASSDGSEVYYFDSLGRIALTRTGLTGSTLYTFNYDSLSQKLISITDNFNHTIKFKYNSGYINQIISAENIKTNLTIDQNGYLSSVVNPKGETYKLTYKPNVGLLDTFTKPTGVKTTFTYDEAGNLIKDQNAAGNSVTLNKTSNGIQSISAMGRITQNIYDPETKTEIEIRPSGLATTYINSPDLTSISNIISVTKSNLTNDPRFGDQVKTFATTETTNFGTTQTVVEDAVNLNDLTNPFSIDQLTKVTTEGNSEITSTFNGLTRTATISSKLGRNAITQIDDKERPILEQTGNLLPNKYFYNNELLSKITKGARQTTLSYETGTKLLSKITNSLNQTVSFSYDEAQRLKSKRLPDGRIINFQYDSNNNLVSITPPGRPAHSQTYGQNELLSSYNPPALQGVTNVSTLYSYNKDKDLVKITRPDGEVINFNYNLTTGLLDSMSGSFGTIAREYQNEQLTKISDNSGNYVLLGYTGKVISSLETKDYKFSRTPSVGSAGQVGSETISANGKSQSISYSYDEDKFLTQAGNLKLEYNSPNGQLIKTNIGNINETYTYNNMGEVNSFKAVFNKNGIQKVLYSYALKRDILGRITKKIEFFGEENKHHEKEDHRERDDKIKNEYVYDSAGRLIHVHGSRRNSNYIYDQNSNRIHGHAGDEEFNAIYDNQDRLIRMNNSIFTYNANGDLLSKSEKHKNTYNNVNYIYDVFGNLKQAGNASYKIDLLNRRSERLVNGVVTSKFAYNPEGQLIAELDKNGNLKKTFIYASKSHVPDYFIDENQNEFKIIVDKLGSLRLIVNSSSGEIVEKMNHDEFGKILVDSKPGIVPFGFAGGLYDSTTKLVRFGARDYDPETGRWTNKDPIRFDAKDTNLYGYVFIDPVNKIDPSGLSWDKIPGYALIGGIIGIVVNTCSKPKDGEKEDNSRNDEIAQCNKDKSRILDECAQGLHNPGICQSVASRVCR